jgi:hypothetical protein
MTMTTPDKPDGWLVPPLWLQAHDLTQEDLDELKARFLAAVERGDPPIVLNARIRWWEWRPVQWWEWRPVQWWWYRQYKRADRRAFRRECDRIRWRGIWRPVDR